MQGTIKKSESSFFFAFILGERTHVVAPQIKTYYNNTTFRKVRKQEDQFTAQDVIDHYVAKLFDMMNEKDLYGKPGFERLQKCN